MKAKFTPPAEEQLFHAIAWIQEDDPLAAERFFNRVMKTVERITEFPASGTIIREFPDRPFREFIVKPYRFFYWVTKNEVWIVGVWHGAQLPEEPGA